MTSFRFPPPPPPPPPSTASAQDNSQNSYSSNQRGGYNNPRGGRGWSGRGGGGRGRGIHNRGNTRGGYGQNSGRSDGNWQPHAQQAPQNHAVGPPASLPPGSFVNPQSQWAAAGQWQTNSVAHPHAMPSITSQVGTQNIGSHMHNPNSSNSGPQYNSISASIPSDQHYTSKRKRDSSRATGDTYNHTRPTNVPSSSQSPQQSKKPQKVKAETAPAIPSFGFSLPVPRIPAGPQLAPSGKGASGPKVHLGLTPRNEQDAYKEPENSSGEEEDIDEEAAYKKNFNGISFEYNGQVMSLQTPTEIATFMKERKRQYPTRQRIAEKAREVATKRERELEFLKKVKAQTAKSRGLPLPDNINNNSGKIKPQAARDAVSKKQKELAALRKRVESSAANKNTSSIAINPAKTPALERKPPNIDLGINYDSDTPASDVSSVLSSSEVSSSDLESEPEEEDDSDDAPEEQTSKIDPPKPKPPPPLAQPTMTPNSRVCDNWKRDGNCKFGKRCRYAHPLREVKKRMGLYDVFVQKEKEQADALALQAIKYLGSRGLLG